ncbi:MAG: threonine dehydrogenase-like Zn-dependent dehydrogenase [Planctomycetota bacterium]|jgi:threonine dehydrogenase-like Zn-dependent dehydrogenase
MKITEVVLTAPRHSEIRDVELERLAPRDVLVEVRSCGVCSSELPVWRGETKGVRGVSFRYADYPASLGHEVAGVVADVGADVSAFKVGDRVTGVAYRGSGFASHVVDDESMFVRAPENVAIETALGEPLMAVTNIVRQADADLGDFALIVGDGFLSLLTVALLSKHPLRGLVVVGHHDERLALAKEFGATEVVNGKTEDAYWAVRKLVDGDLHDPDLTPWKAGVELAFEYAGNMGALQLAASLCKAKSRAKLVMPSFYSQDEFTLGHYLMNRGPQLLVCHPAHSPDLMDDLRRAMWALEAGLFPIEPLITHAFDLSGVDRAMQMSADREDGYIKGIVVPNFESLENPTGYRRITTA